MAFRIHDSVVRGEIDNRVKGIVRGKVWVVGRSDPVVLELKGNAWPDLAGCLLTFTNPLKPIAHPHLDALYADQSGVIGDLTASRKVRVFDVPLEQALEMIHRKERPPEHLANSLYLEWYSEANGRVVVESADYKLTISAPEWRMTPAEEQQRATEAAAAMEEFLKKLTAAIDEQQESHKDPEQPWTEHDYEAFLKEADARTDKYMELFDKYGDSEEAQEKIDHAMGWDKEPETDGGELPSIEELNAICEEAANEPRPEPDPAREGIDWIRTSRGRVCHPLQHRSYESAMKFRHQVDELGLKPYADKDLEQFLSEFQTTAAKLAGALTGIARNCAPEPAFTVACLKRALSHLHAAQAGLAGVASRNVLPEPTLAEAQQELFAIREGILRLMDDFRGRGQA